MEVAKSFLSKYRWPMTLLLIMIITACIWPPVFYLNDDVTMRSILSGAYTGVPDGHVVYMQYPLSVFLALLYRILPIIPWMEFFFSICLWACMLILTKESANKVMGMTVAIVFVMPFYLYMHYTVVAAVVAATAIFLVCTGRKKPVSLILFWIAYMIRSQVGLLSLPFILAALCWDLLEHQTEWKKHIRGLLKYIGGLVLGLLAITGIHAIAYRSEEWQEYQDYNETRTLLYDYTDFLSTNKYGESCEAYAMTEDEYELLFSYNILLDNRLNREKLDMVLKRIEPESQSDENVLSVWKECVYQYYIQFRYSDSPYNYIWLGTMLLFMILFGISKKYLQLLFIVLLGGGRSIIWMYLLWRGRFPERVSISLYVLEILLLWGIGLQYVQKLRVHKRKAELLIIAVLILLGGYLGKDTILMVRERNVIQTEWDCVKEYCEQNPGKSYLLDVFSSVKYSDRLYEEDSANLMLLGGWLSRSPLTNERLRSLGGNDAAEVLWNNEDARIVISDSRDIEWMKEYIRKRFGSGELDQEEHVTWQGGGFRVYRLER